MSCHDNTQRKVARKIEDSLATPSPYLSSLSLSRVGLAVWHLARLYQSFVFNPLSWEKQSLLFFFHIYGIFFSRELSCSFCLVCFHRKLVLTADRSCDIPWWLSHSLGPCCVLGILGSGSADRGTTTQVRFLCDPDSCLCPPPCSSLKL